MNIDLTPEQSKIFREKKELIWIEPMNPQPDDLYFEVTTGTSIKLQCPYKVGQEINIRHEWTNNLRSNPESYCGVRWDLCSPETMPKKLWKTAIVKEILEPCRVQDIGTNVIKNIIGYNSNDKTRFKNLKAKLRLQYNFKNWFNYQFSNPKPVKCDHCNCGKELWDNICPECGGDGIGSYIGYVHDEDIPESILRNEKYDIWPESYSRGELLLRSFFGFILRLGLAISGLKKKKELKIIVDPFCWLVRIGE
jgi:hypothetical protein